MTTKPPAPPQGHVDPRFEGRERQPGLDLLRALAIILVVIYHAGIMGFPLPSRVHRWGWIGVDLFFVLSGYLIGGQLLAELARSERLHLARFYARRALRIMPAYFVILTLYFLLPSWREYSDMAQPLWKFLLSIQNIALHGGTAFSHAWSLAVEDQFYLALPFILLVLFWRPRSAMLLSCVIVVGGVLLRAFLVAQNPSVDGGVSFRGFQAWIYYPTWTRLDPLVFGVVIAAIEKVRPRLWQQLINSAIWLWLPALALIVYALWLGESDYINFNACVWQFPLLAIAMAALLDLRGQPAPAITAVRNSRRGVHRQHCLQRVSRAKARYPRRGRILPGVWYRSEIRSRINLRGILRLCCRHDCLFHSGATLPAAASPHRAKESWYSLTTATTSSFTCLKSIRVCRDQGRARR